MFASILDTGHALPDRTRGRATTHSSHQLSSQSAQIPDLESDSDSDLDSASDALASCVEVVGIMTTLGFVLPWGGSLRAARHTGGREGWGDNCGLSVAASSSASGPVSACPRRICIGIGLALVVQVRVYLAYDALYTPSNVSPPPFLLPLSVCPSRRPIKY